ncbi:MAG: hypothetical protein RIA63_12775 [Cyclobacteriaceae bacterium]
MDHKEPAHIPVPKKFCNSETNVPFDECLMCHQSLKSTQYVVEKAIKNYPSLGTSEIVFEYAMCLQCAGKMHRELSEESRMRIEAYMRDHLGRKTKMPNEGAANFEESISQCLIKDIPVTESTEYSIYALCNGSEMVVSEFPYAISGEVQDEIMQLLSAKSLDILDDFIGNHFTGPPEIREILRRRPVLI